MLNNNIKKDLVHKNNLQLDNNNKFSLTNLSKSLVLSVERSKVIYDLYEKNNVLSKRSNALVQELKEEKNLTQLQSEFVSLVSHEFKNPLSIIKTAVDILKRCENPEKALALLSDQVTKIDKAVLRMDTLIETTLNLSRLESGSLEFKPTSFCIETLLLEIIDRYKDLELNINFIVEINLHNKFIDGDKNLIDQIFSNLISNAIKYSDIPAQVTIICHIKDNHVIVTVADNGIGIEDTDLDRLFDKFYRAHNAIGVPGTGIGLYLVKQFAELHNGSINVESRLNAGSKFTLSLPIEE